QTMKDTVHDPNQMSGAAMVVRALKDHGVKHLFGYPGGAVLPIYDEIFQQSDVQHVLVRHEQGAGHAAEGYARSTGLPGVVLGTYHPPRTSDVHVSYSPRVKGDAQQIRKAVALLANAKRPIIYSGGGVINAGREASKLLRELVQVTGFPITSTLMGLGAYPASGKNWLGMLGMHGTYEANMTMHGCDAMLCVGARFDDRITGRVGASSP